MQPQRSLRLVRAAPMSSFYELTLIGSFWRTVWLLL